MPRKRDAIREKVLAYLRRTPFWHQGAAIAKAIGHPYAAATVTAKIRDLRKKPYGSHEIRCCRFPGLERGNAKVYMYRLVR